VRIGKLAERSGVRAKTIRYYEEIGLLAEPRRLANGYRSFGEDDCERLRFIRRAKGLGLRLAAIRGILELYDAGGVPCPRVRQVARQRLSELDQQISRLQQLRSDVATLLETADEPYNVETRMDGEICPLIDVAEQARRPSLEESYVAPTN